MRTPWIEIRLVEIPSSGYMWEATAGDLIGDKLLVPETDERIGGQGTHIFTFEFNDRAPVARLQLKRSWENNYLEEITLTRSVAHE